jgi:diguanylate cyclase (GGDEF)-like protein
VNEFDDTTALVNPDSVEASAVRGRAYLVVVRGSNVGEIYEVVGPETVIGRTSGVDIRLNDEGVSRFHCKLRHDPTGVVVEDLASRNGTFCNGERVVPGMQPLVEGDRLQVGTTSVLRFTYEEKTIEPATAHTIDDQTSSRDELTGTYSRRFFIDQLETEVAYALDHKTALSLLLLHVDRFDESRKILGPTLADTIVRQVAGHILENIHAEDLLARFTGGDFALLSRSASPGDTFMLAERLRKSSANLAMPLSDAPRITLSLAVASISELRIETAKDLLLAGDRALNRARSRGGDRVVLCTDDLLREPKDRLV